MQTKKITRQVGKRRRKLWILLLLIIWFIFMETIPNLINGQIMQIIVAGHLFPLVLTNFYVTQTTLTHTHTVSLNEIYTVNASESTFGLYRIALAPNWILPSLTEQKWKFFLLLIIIIKKYMYM